MREIAASNPAKPSTTQRKGIKKLAGLQSQLAKASGTQRKIGNSSQECLESCQISGQGSWHKAKTC